MPTHCSLSLVLRYVPLFSSYFLLFVQKIKDRWERGGFKGIEGVHEGRDRRLKAMLEESQMTVAAAIQCRYPTEFDLK